MDERFRLKYNRLLDILGDVACCASRRMILVGGTALALFYLKHRLSIDLDFVPAEKEDSVEKLKQALKGCLSGKGYKTIAGAYTNQFVVQFEDTSIKIEVFVPERKIKKILEFEFGNEKLLVASLEDLLELKKLAYADRREARDLYDVIAILRKKNESRDAVKKLMEKYGKPVNAEEVEKMSADKETYSEFKELVGID